MGKNIQDIYNDILGKDGLFNENSQYDVLSRNLQSHEDDADFEMFTTSKEVAKRREKANEKRESHLEVKDGIVDEVVHFKRYTKRREHKYTEQEMEEIRQSCMSVIVHDYGEQDVYHLSDEERHNNDVLAEISMKLAGLKRTYRQVDKYVEAMRIVVEAWKILEKSNFLHSKEEFFEMVSKGKIISSQIIMPKLKRMDMYNMDLIIKYISNPELDAKELAPKKATSNDSWYDQFDDTDEYEDEEEKMLRLLDPDEVEFIINNSDNPPEIEVVSYKRRDIRGYDKRSFTYTKNRKKQKLSKNERSYRESVHAMLNQIQSNPENSNSYGGMYSYALTHGLFDPDESMVKKHSFWDDIRFDGSWANDDDLFLYDLAVREEMLQQHPLEDKRYYTYGAQEIQNFFKILEANGINTVDLRRKMDETIDSSKKEEDVHTKKENKRMERILIQRITKLNNDPKFKKIVAKAENAINKHQGG